MVATARNLSEPAAVVECKRSSAPTFAKTQPNINLNCSKTYPGEGLSGDDVAVAHLDDAGASSGCFRIVGDHDDRLVEASIEFLKHVQHDG